MSKITLKELAERTGLSVSAVSLALNDRPGISEENRDRVLRLAQELGYQHTKPKPSARKNKQIAIVHCNQGVINTSDAIFPQLMNSITEAAEEAGWTVKLYFKPHGKPLSAETLQFCTGLILLSNGHIPAAEVQEMLALGLPTVLLDFEIPFINCNAVTIDNTQAIQQGFYWLREHGYERIAYAGYSLDLSPHSYFNEAARERAYRLCAAQEGKQALLCTIDQVDPRQSFLNWYQALERKPDAFLISMDYLARELLPLMELMKLNVGRDCAMISLDNLSFCETSNPPLSSVDLNTAERGRVAFQRLMTLIRQPDAIPQRIRVGTHLVLRDSSPHKA